MEELVLDAPTTVELDGGEKLYTFIADASTVHSVSVELGAQLQQATGGELPHGMLTVYADVEGMCGLEPCMNFEIPKSAKTQWSYSSRRMFAGFRSCRMICCSCSSTMARQISAP